MNHRQTMALLPLLALSFGASMAGGELGGGFNVPSPRRGAQPPEPWPDAPTWPDTPARRPRDGGGPFLPKLEAPEVEHVETKGRRKGTRAQRKAARGGR